MAGARTSCAGEVKVLWRYDKGQAISCTSLCYGMWTEIPLHSLMDGPLRNGLIGAVAPSIKVFPSTGLIP